MPWRVAEPSSLHRERRRVAWLLAFLVVLAMSVRAEEWCPTRSFRVFGKATWRGLPQSSVMAMAQDVDGVLWIGTLDGAASFDGRTITPVPAIAGAPLRGLIAAIVARKGGGVYIASPAGVHVYDGATWRLVPTRKAAVALAETTDGTLWMADVEGSLWTLRGRDAWERHTEAGVPAIALASARDGSLWIATDRNALHLRGGHIDPVAGAPLPGRPGAMVVAHDGRVWIATLTNTVHWTSGADGWHQAAFAPWPRGAFRCIAEDRKGRIWAGAFGGRVAFGNAETPWTVWAVQQGPFEAGVMSLLGDREGNVWFGLNALGLAQWIGEEWSHRTTVDPWSNTARMLFSGFAINRGATPHSLLVAVYQNGGLRLDADSARQFGAADGLTEDVRTLVEPEPGVFYAGTRFGIFEARRGEKFRQVLKLPAGFVMGLFHSTDGRWYAGSSTQGVFVRDHDAWQRVDAWNAQLDDMHVRDMKWLRNGEVWVATLRGVTIFRGNVAEHLTSKQQPAIPESVNAVLEAGDEMWVGGTGGVAVRRAGKWQRMTEVDGVPGQTVYSLGRDRDGTIWAGGSAGVGRYREGHWRVWDSREGLLQEECNLGGLVVDDDGVVYVGTMAGLARFDPNVRAVPPPPLNLRWRTTPSRDARGVAHLTERDRALHLGWSAAWLGPHPLQYRVRVPRLRNEWSAPSADDHLDIENVGAGDWRVEVQARVEGTHEWTAPIALDIDVAPFWYETLAARLGMAALLIALIYGAVVLRLRALRRHAAMLEEVVRERTAQLAVKIEQLHDSEQRALAASRAKSAFLANMSHELRTPLNGVLGFAQLLSRRKERDAEDREGLDVIMKSGEHLLGLINDVLSLSKIEAGRVNLDREPFALDTLVQDVENVLRVRAEEKNLRMLLELERGAIPQAVLGDAGKLRQILINLVGNAVKFTDSGSVTLRVAWSGGRARFDVEDTGPGIGREELPRLFEPFVQTDSGHRAKEGTGLGLALSRDLARLMGGDITVDSEPGRGSRFHVDIALPEAGADAMLAASDRRRVASLAPGQEGIRILVVDDTPLNRTVLTRLLTSVGFEVRDAANGEEALVLVEMWQPHFIWMDKRMQGIDGLEATRRIRASEAAAGRPRVPIIALSASALEHERVDVLAAGCDDFVAKPFRESIIFAKLREHLGVAFVYDGEPPPAPALVSSAPREIAATNGSVLLVDDDWICREVAQELLRSEGLAVTLAASGREAVDLVAANRYDLVFMDVQMPEMDGVEATRRIKSSPGRERLPVIAMSADPFANDGETIAGGMDDYIVKPVEPESVRAMLARWLPLRIAP
jgi:signal transduction histidine kinase/DNA-binding response OmpR family regulator/ligand-binding sensor domain-containing protein